MNEWRGAQSECGRLRVRSGSRPAAQRACLLHVHALQRVPAWQRVVFTLFYWPIMAFMIKVLGVNAKNAAMCVDKVNNHWALQS